MQQHERYQEAKLVTLVGGASNVFLGVIKLIGGILFQSHALVADGFHSFADLISDFMVLVISKYSSHDADDEHPYGHQRIETAGTLMISLLLIMAGSSIVWDSINALMNHHDVIPQWLALPVVVISIIINEAMFQYTYFIGKKIKSELIISNAWHRRSDAASSLVVLIGLLGNLLGIPYLDIIAAIIVGVMIIKMGWDYGWNSVQQLVDSGVDAELLKQIKETICAIDGVKTIHLLRSRMMGQAIFIDLHIIVSPMISVSEGHFIASTVHYTLMRQIDNVKDVTVHVDAEDDEMISPSMHLPNRAYLEQSFLLALQKEFPAIKRWVIHYLNGTILIELVLDANFTQRSELNARVAEELAKCKESIKISYLMDVT